MPRFMTWRSARRPWPVPWLALGWRSWLYLLLGGALLVPVTSVLAALLWPVQDVQTLLLLWLACAAAAGLMALLRPVRDLEATAARDLLELRSADHAAAPGLYALAVVHLVLGATHSATTLFLVVPTLWFAVTGRDSPWPGVTMGVAAAVVLVLWAGSVLALGVLLHRVGRLVLRPDPARRLEALGRRDALARDLHDSLGHALAAISVQAAALEARLGPQADGPVQRHLSALASASREAQGELDQALGLLRDDDGGSPGLEAAHRLVAGLGTGPGTGLGADREVTLDSALTGRDLAALDGRVSRTAYRILQEATANALRHATGAVSVRLRRDGGHLVLEVSSGRPRRGGTDPTGEAGRSGADHRSGPADRSVAPVRRSTRGSGLAGMHRRAALAGGALRVDEDPAGWTVRAELPL